MPNELHVRVSRNADRFDVDLMRQLPSFGETHVAVIGTAYTEQAARENALRYLAALIVETQHVDLS